MQMKTVFTEKSISPRGGLLNVGAAVTEATGNALDRPESKAGFLSDCQQAQAQQEWLGCTPRG